MRKWLLLSGAAVVLLVLAAWLEPTRTVVGTLLGEPFAANRPAGYWKRALRSDDPVQRERAYQTLREQNAESVEVLISLLKNAQEAPEAAELRWTAAELLGKIGPQAKAASSSLLAALNDADPHVRAVAAAAVPEVDTPAENAVPALIELLPGDAGRVAARALSKYRVQAAPAIPALIKMLNDDSLDSETRWNAARTLGKIGPPAKVAVGDLVSHLDNKIESIREHAAEALGDIGPEAREATPDLIKVLTDPATKVRRDAARSLGQIGKDASAALPDLRKLSSDPEKIVRDAAQTSIEQIESKTP